MSAAYFRAVAARAHATCVNTPEAWLVAADAAEEASRPPEALVYRFLSRIPPRRISPLAIVDGLQRVGARAHLGSGARMDNVPFDANAPRNFTRRKLYPLFQALATVYVGDDKTALYFISNRRGVFAVYPDRDDAIDLAHGRDLYVEGPRGEEWHASWA